MAAAQYFIIKLMLPSCDDVIGKFLNQSGNVNEILRGKFVVQNTWIFHGRAYLVILE